MTFEMDDEARGRLHKFFTRIGSHLPDVRQRASFAMYALGLMGKCERKSVEPIAAELCKDPKDCQRLQHSLLDFLRVGRWRDGPVRLEAARYAIEAVSRHDEAVHCWIIDDTGFPKQGTESVGVQRQYTGTVGKTANCQVAVSLCIASRAEQFPIDFDLYLPESWMDNPERRDKVRIPQDRKFKTKTQLALDMIDRAAQEGIPGDVVLTDSAYGESVEFRGAVRLLGFDYGVGVHSPTKVWLVDSRDKIVGDAIGVQKLGVELGRKAFRKYSWREGTNGKKLWGRFCFRRVKVAADDGVPLAQREVVWLMMEWPSEEPKPTKFVLTTMPRRMTKKAIVRIVKERWKTERMYEEMKGELGLDHYEGRSFPGWNHHVTVAICSYAFMISERARAFSPQTGGQRSACSYASAA
jgi:SRSO17 transposase